jgi:hypothetical protein
VHGLELGGDPMKRAVGGRGGDAREHLLALGVRLGLAETGPAKVSQTAWTWFRISTEI